jgi:serine/threonine-protein kinase
MEPQDRRRIEELYHAALERAPAERGAFLVAECGSDEALRREVLSLLARVPQAERLMEAPAAAAGTKKRALLDGARLGPYEILDLVGAGGMGEVYRARDTRLGRDVAIKVLPAAAASDEDALARFGREARAVAALNHPHIATLFDIGEHEGAQYLAMELLEGETLAERVKRGPLREKDALRIGAEIAEALAAAHRQGVVHRDVKPANVVLTRTGAKLLDFGLARLPGTPGAAGVALTAGSSLTTATLAGRLAGTLPYMAPEQLEGREADARSDIWALGCVLHEMLAGRRAFEGNSPAGLIAAIEKDDAPSIVARRPGAPVGIDFLVRRCLRKDPAERWQSAQDLGAALEWITAAGPVAGVRGAGESRRRMAVIAAALTVAVLAGLIGGRLWPGSTSGPSAGPVVRAHIDLPPQTELTKPSRRLTANAGQLASSPDGALLIWSGAPARSGEPEAQGPAARALPWLYEHRLDTGNTVLIPGTEGANQPFFSPDGRWIGFWAERKIRKVPVGGGIVADLADVEFPPRGMSWAPDGRIFLGSSGNAGTGLRFVPEAGGSLQTLVELDRSREAVFSQPWVLPGGKALLLTTMPHFAGVRARVEALSLVDGARRVLVEDAADARYVSTGHLVFVRRAVVMAAPFDLDRLELTGPVVPVLENVSQSLNRFANNSGAAQLTVSPSGLLVYATGGMQEDGRSELVLVDGGGRAVPLPGFDKPLVNGQVRFSPDGRHVAFSEKASSGLLWLFDLERHTHQALSREGVAGWPRWSPDGTRLAVSWSAAGPMNLWELPADGTGAWRRLTDVDALDIPSSWSPDGRYVAFVRSVGARPMDVFLYRFEDGQVVPFLTTAAREMSAEFSPDGRWLAYVSNETGREEVYLTSFPGRERTLSVSREGGAGPAWSRDGRTLFYLQGEESIMSVAVTGGPPLSLGLPKVVCRRPPGLSEFPSVFPVVRSYDLHPDGRRFAFGTRGQEESSLPVTRLNLVHNWFAELERLSPTRRRAAGR